MVLLALALAGVESGVRAIGISDEEGRMVWLPYFAIFFTVSLVELLPVVWAMLMAKLMAITLFPDSGVGEVMANVRQLFSSIFRKTCVRRRSNTKLFGSLLLIATIRLFSRCSIRTSTTRVCV
jgi:hypothetical protein